MNGVLTRKNYRNTGIETFMENVVPQIIEENTDIEPIYWQASDLFPFSKTLSGIIGSKTLPKRFDSYEKVLVTAQNRMVVNPEDTSAELIPYVHDILPITTNFSGWLATPQGKWMLNNVEKCEEVICGSKNTRRELYRRTRFNGESHVIYQGVDHLPRTESGARDIDILYVGSLIDRKNPEFTRETLQRADEQGFEVATVNFRPTDLPGETYIDITDEELAEVYSRARYYLHPSMAEGFGRGPVEAQRYGALPLGFDIPINHEVLGAEGLAWISIREIDDVMALLDSSIDSMQRAKARENSERFKWGETRKKVVEILRGERSGKAAAEEAVSLG